MKNVPRFSRKTYGSTEVQKSMPYLIKQKFIPLENDKVDIQRYKHEEESDPLLFGFKQSKDNYRVHRLNPNEPITRKNPFSDMQKIKICNSFHLNKKAMNQTIRTLMQGDIDNVERP